MGETLEENWISETIDGEDGVTQFEEEHKPEGENNKTKRKAGSDGAKDVSKELHKKPAEKTEKKRGLRSLSRPEDQGMLSTEEKVLAETFWNHYIKAQGKNLTKLQQSDILATSDKCFVTCRSEAGWKNCGVIIKAGLSSWKKQLNTETLKLQSPRVLVVCGSANRAISLIKEIRSATQNLFFVGKFFSRHIKYKQNVQMLKDNDGKNVPIVVGTPARINRLLQEKHLLLTSTELMIIDMSRDRKYIYTRHHDVFIRRF